MTRTEAERPRFPRSGRPWMAGWLLAAAAYNLAFGAWAIVLPGALFSWAGMAGPNYPELWQCIGMIVGVYGIGYAIAARDPLRHWPIVLVGLLGKIFGPIGFAQALWQGALPLTFGAILLTNDLIWWVPFALILRSAFVAGRRGHAEPAAREPVAAP
jgi:small multidrug resistance pump